MFAIHLTGNCSGAHRHPYQFVSKATNCCCINKSMDLSQVFFCLPLCKEVEARLAFTRFDFTACWSCMHLLRRTRLLYGVWKEV